MTSCTAPNRNKQSRTMGLDDFERELAAEQAEDSSSRKRERSRSRDGRHRHSSKASLYSHSAVFWGIDIFYSSTVAAGMIGITTPRGATTATRNTTNDHIASTSAHGGTTTMAPNPMKSVSAGNARMT